jgi:hypothetical protein
MVVKPLRGGAPRYRQPRLCVLELYRVLVRWISAFVPKFPLAMSTTIDLITPPPSPNRDGMAAIRQGQRSTAALGKRKAETIVLSEDEDEKNPECSFVPRPAHANSSFAPFDPLAGEAGEMSEANEDVVLVGRSGAIALVDFPHARFNCVLKPFQPAKEADHCPNCYCYVCDAVASACPCWSEHCKAVHSDKVWQQRRQDWARGHRGDRTAAAAASAPSVPSVPRAGSSCPSRSSAGVSSSTPTVNATEDTPWTCGLVMSRVEQVYPVEAPEPPGLLEGCRLRAYQKQSLGFMLDVERGNTNVRAVDGALRTLGNKLTPRGGWLCDEVGSKCCLVECFHCLPAPILHRASTSLAQ